jgi:hypothetical protein
MRQSWNPSWARRTRDWAAASSILLFISSLFFFFFFSENCSSGFGDGGDLGILAHGGGAVEKN